MEDECLDVGAGGSGVLVRGTTGERVRQCREGQGMVRTLVVRADRGQRAHRGREIMRGGRRYACVHVYAHFRELSLHLEMEKGWEDVYRAPERECGPLPLLAQTSPPTCTW